MKRPYENIPSIGTILMRNRRLRAFFCLAATAGAVMFLAGNVQAVPAGDPGFITIDGAKVHPTRILVKFKEGVQPAITQDQAGQLGSKMFRRYRTMPALAVLDEEPRGSATAATTQEAKRNRLLQRIATLQKSGMFEYVEPDYIAELLLAPTDAAFVDGRLWGLLNWGQQGGVRGADISATNAWDITTGSTNVIVAVIDTGVRYTHQDLASQMWRNTGEIPGNNRDDDGNGYVDDVFGINAVTGSGEPMDDDGHGTHVAGTIGAAANGGGPHVGVAWQVSLMACKFLSADGWGTYSDAIECIDYSISKGARILNNSWGGYRYSHALFDAIDRARLAGALFVAAAGNEGNDNDVFPLYPASYPLENVISVAAIDRRDRLADFSNYGRNTVHLGAPGVEIFSTVSTANNAYEIFDGTSVAAPHVAGVAALILGRYPGADVEEMRARILLGAVPTPALQGRTVTGGRLNAYNSLSLSGGPNLQVTIDPPSGSFLLTGSQQPIFVRVRDPFSVVNATVVGTVAGVTNLVFANDGRPPDAIAGDSVYSAMFRVPTWTNAVTMTVGVTAPGKVPRTNVVYYAIVPPPPNDHFTNAIKVPVGGATYQFNNRFATREPGEPNHGGVTTNAASLWWNYTPNTTTNVFVDPTGSAVDTIVAVYVGNTLTNLQQVAAANDIGLYKQAYLSFSGVAGQTYRIAVASTSTNSLGSVQVRIEPGGAPDTTPPQVFVSSPINGSTVMSSLLTLTGTASDPWPNISGVTEVQISVNGGLPSTAAGTTNWNMIALLRPGVNTIQARAVDAAGNFSAPVTIQVYCLVLDPPNDIFVNAIELTGLSGSSSVVTTNATKEVGEPNHAGNLGGKSVWWYYTAPTDGVLTLSTSNSSYDTVLAVYTGDRVGSLRFLSANDDAYDGVRWSRITQAVRSNVTYRIVVDGYDGASGVAVLHYAFSEAPVYTLSVTNTPGGFVEVQFGTTTLSLVSDLPANASVRLVAVPYAGWQFDIWEGDMIAFNNPLTVVVGGDMSLTAQFRAVAYTDGFESGNFQTLPWTSAGAKPWIVQSTNVATGGFAARSGQVTHSQTSSLLLTVPVRAGTGSFTYRVSSETGFDFLEFYINGLLSGRWSGEVGWATHQFQLTAGTHTFEWRYAKDATVSAGMDAAFIDNVMLPLVVQPDGTARARLTIKRATGGVFYIEGLGQKNQTYITQVSTNLVNWQNIATNLALDGFFRVIDYGSPTNKTRFYRTVVLPQ